MEINVKLSLRKGAKGALIISAPLVVIWIIVGVGLSVEPVTIAIVAVVIIITLQLVNLIGYLRQRGHQRVRIK